MTDDAKSTVRVTIFGDEYAIRSEMGEEYTLRCAQHVDEAIQEAHVGGHVAELHKAAILAAMGITDALFRCRRESERRTSEVAERLANLRARVEEVLG
ncbi:MAG: cell division protein ZapA [Gemmatimonadota bacterium]